MNDEHLRHIRVLESQIEGNREVAAALRELEENLVVRIDDSAGETAALVEIATSFAESFIDWKARSMRWRFRATATRLRDRPTL
jgi:hypothetical protein